MSKFSLEPVRPSRASLVGAFDSIRKMERALMDLRRAHVEATEDFIAAKAESICNVLATTAAEVFGAGTADAERMSRSCSTLFEISRGTDVDLQLRAFERGRARAIALVEREIAALRERIDDAPSIAPKPAQARDELDLHPDIEEAAGALFRSGHHANAIEDAVKALNALIRYRSKLNLDGAPLVRKAFSLSDPILKFNDLSDEAELNEQKAFIAMLSGVMGVLHNRRAPKMIREDRELAQEFIAMVSFLAKLVETAKR